MAEQKKNTSKLKKKLTKKFRLVVLNEESFEERFSFKLTRLNVFVLGGLFSILLVAFTVVLIAYTPLKEYIPGFSSTKLKKQATQLFYEVDSLQAKINVLQKFTEAIRPILVGDDAKLELALPYTNSAALKIAAKNLPVSNDSIKDVIEKIRVEIDSTLRLHYEKERETLLKNQKVTVEELQRDHQLELDRFEVGFAQKIDMKTNQVKELSEKLSLKNKAYQDLEKAISLKEIEIKNNYQSLSKDNKSSLEKAKQEIELLLKKQYISKQKELSEKHKNELLLLEKELSLKQEKLISLEADYKKQLQNQTVAIASLEKKLAIEKSKNSSELTSKYVSKESYQSLEDRLKNEFQKEQKSLLADHEQQKRNLSQRIFEKESIIDSLTFQIANYQQQKIGDIHLGGKIANTDGITTKLLQPSKKDSIFRAEVEREDRFSLFDFETSKAEVVFFAPVKGIITSQYNVKENHFAVDVAVTKGAAVKAIADGTVLFSEWTATTGYVIIVEHPNKYISVYKHNEMVYSEQGDLVKSGEVIAMAGSTGEYSTGPHLHFEMWNQGYPVNPVNFIEFE